LAKRLFERTEHDPRASLLVLVLEPVETDGLGRLQRCDAATGGPRSLRREEIADTFSRLPLATIYGEGGNLMNAEDLTEIERAGRRCGVCHSGRGWRGFEIVRPAEGEPVVLCASCRVRFGDNPPVGSQPAAASDPAPAALKPVSPPSPRAGERRTERRPDRLRTALRMMPGSFSTAMAARAAGLNNDKTLARLQDLERRGEVQRLGNRWSTEPPASDIASAMDRLEARTSNLRIVRDRERAG
jgi:hypothetical protein